MKTRPPSAERRNSRKLVLSTALYRMVMMGILLLAAPLQGLEAQATSPEGTLDTLAENHYLPSLRAAFGTFTFEFTDLPTPFARWLEDRIIEAAPRSKRVQILNRNAAAAMDPAFRQNYEAFFRETGTDALLLGRYFLEGSQVRVRLELTDLGSGTLIGAGDWFISAAEVPPYASVKPALADSQRAAELARLGVSNDGGLQISLSTDRGSGAAYRNGEDMTVMVTVNKNAYVRLYHVDSAGMMQLIWPNRFSGNDGRISSGQPVQIPAAGDPFRFHLQPPYGTEFIKAVASTLPFTQSQSDFSNLGTNYRVAATRGLAVTGTGPGRVEQAEALASYYIGP